MTDKCEPLDDFSPILIENYIRTEVAWKNIQNEDDENGTKTPIAVKFKIEQKYYQQILDCEYPAPLIGLSCEYEENTSVLTAMPNDKFIEHYHNQINRDVAQQQDERLHGRYANFIEVL